MPRTDSSEHYDFYETEKRDLINLIEQGKPLPEKYRFLLFADKREVEPVWNGIFENEWQSFRTRQSRELELRSAEHTYARRGRYTVAVKVMDIFGNDTMTLVPVSVG